MDARPTCLTFGAFLLGVDVQADRGALARRCVETATRATVTWARETAVARGLEADDHVPRRATWPVPASGSPRRTVTVYSGPCRRAACPGRRRTSRRLLEAAVDVRRDRDVLPTSASRTPGWLKVISMPVSRGHLELSRRGWSGPRSAARPSHGPGGLGGAVGAPERRTGRARRAQRGGRPEDGVASIDLRRRASLIAGVDDEAPASVRTGVSVKAASAGTRSRPRRSSRRPGSPPAARARGGRARRASSSRSVGDVGGSVGRTVTPGEAPDRAGVGARESVRRATPVGSLGRVRLAPRIGADGPGLAQPATRAMATRSTGIAPPALRTGPRLVDGRRVPPLIVPLPAAAAMEAVPSTAGETPRPSARVTSALRSGPRRRRRTAAAAGDARYHGAEPRRTSSRGRSPCPRSGGLEGPAS